MADIYLDKDVPCFRFESVFIHNNYNVYFVVHDRREIKYKIHILQKAYGLTNVLAFRVAANSYAVVAKGIN